MRTLPALAAITLSAGLLTGCGGGTDAYCDQLKSDKKYFDSIEGGDFSKFDEAIQRFHELADKAPDDVADDWKIVDGAFEDVEKALKEAGVTFEDLVKAQQGEVPEGVDQQKLAAMVPKLQAIGSEKFTKASDAIEKHAKSECGVSLS